MSYNVWFIHFTRKNVAYVHLLAGHRFDPNTPIEETMHALHDVVKAGYVRYIGMSSCYAYQCEYLLDIVHKEYAHLLSLSHSSPDAT